AGETSRAQGMGQTWGLIGAKEAMGTLIGPFPDRVATNVHWETRGGIGLTWAILSILGARLGGRAARVPAYIALGMLAFALGGSLLFEHVPVFSTFRMPTRMLLTLTFPIAYLTAVGVQRIRDEWHAGTLFGTTFVAVGVVVLPVLVSLVAALVNGDEIPLPRLRETNLGWRSYWLIIPGAWVSFLRIAPHVSGDTRARFVAAILVADVLLFALPYPNTRPTGEIYPRSPLIDPLRSEDQFPGSLAYDPSGDDSNDSFFGPGSPLASAHGVRSVRGYNPLDVARYRRFLAFVADLGEPQQAFSGKFTHPVVVDFEVKNRRLFDLLGVAWVVTRTDEPPAGDGWVTVAKWIDPAPRTYNFLGRGVQTLPPMRIYVNLQSMPRAFLVAAAEPEAPDNEVLDQLKGIDLWRTVTLAGWDSAKDPLPEPRTGRRWQKIRSTKPNEVTIELDGKSAGLLVLTDPWYPGWVCRIDGTEVPIWRADYAFRGVIVPEGSREVVFRFEPRSYRNGRWVSLVTLTVVAIFFLVTAIRRRA
ncbi:MAG TPA: YfhO family protein, partial [Gemmataceae bacterium]|nr:YfhO family protein [Gemmataceae bacterium]